MQFLRKFRRNVQDHGLKTALGKSVAYLFAFAYKRSLYRLYEIDLAKNKTETPAELEGVEFRFLSAADSEAIRQIEETSEWLQGSMKQRLEAGALCLAAFDQGRLAGFNLVSFGQVYMPLADVSRTFRRHEAWSEQISTVKTFRKKGLASQLRYRIFDELRQRGIRKFYGGALADNSPSLRLAKRVGFREFVEIRYIRVLDSRRWRYVRLRA